MIKLSASTSFLSAVGLLLLHAFICVQGALPPRYEDNMWCPSSSYCDRPVNPDITAGPQSVFHECYNPITNTIIDVWTGSLSETVAPAGWVMDPAPCTTESATVTAMLRGGRTTRSMTPASSRENRSSDTTSSSDRQQRLRALQATDEDYYYYVEEDDGDDADYYYYEEEDATIEDDDEPDNVDTEVTTNLASSSESSAESKGDTVTAIVEETIVDTAAEDDEPDNAGTETPTNLASSAESEGDTVTATVDETIVNTAEDDEPDTADDDNNDDEEEDEDDSVSSSAVQNIDCNGFCEGKSSSHFGCEADVPDHYALGCHKDGGCYYRENEKDAYPYAGFCTYKVNNHSLTLKTAVNNVEKYLREKKQATTSPTGSPTTPQPSTVPITDLPTAFRTATATVDGADTDDKEDSASDKTGNSTATELLTEYDVTSGSSSSISLFTAVLALGVSLVYSSI